MMIHEPEYFCANWRTAARAGAQLKVLINRSKIKRRVSEPFTLRVIWRAALSVTSSPTWFKRRSIEGGSTAARPISCYCQLFSSVHIGLSPFPYLMYIVYHRKGDLSTPKMKFVTLHKRTCLRSKLLCISLILGPGRHPWSRSKGVIAHPMVFSLWWRNKFLHLNHQCWLKHPWWCHHRICWLILS